MSSISRTMARESNREKKLMAQYQPGEAKKPGPTGEKAEKKLRKINAHRRCSKCHTKPTKREVKQVLFLAYSNYLCKSCYAKSEVK